MAIHPKKRDRLTMMSSRPTSTSCASPTSVGDEQAEYERAVAFLAEFRSRRVASPALHSTSLDAIVENDSLDEILAADFALTVGVGRGPSIPDLPRKEGRDSFSDVRLNISTRPSPVGLSGMKKAATTKCLLDLDVNAGAPGLQRTSNTRPGPAGLSKMRRAATSKCLRDLDVASSFNGEPVARPVTPPTSEPDYYFGYQEEISPAAKRRRSLLGR